MNKLGGADFDNKLLEIISNELKKNVGEKLNLGNTHEIIPDVEDTKKNSFYKR